MKSRLRLSQALADGKLEGSELEFAKQFPLVVKMADNIRKSRKIEPKLKTKKEVKHG